MTDVEFPRRLKGRGKRQIPGADVLFFRKSAKNGKSYAEGVHHMCPPPNRPKSSVALSGQQTLVELHASRTNEDVRMYIEEYLF